MRAKSALVALTLAMMPVGAFASVSQECAAGMARRDRLDHHGFHSRAKRYGLRAGGTGPAHAPGHGSR
ncbi:MAG: hypothetical protein C3F17_08920 [Bradyrhizobiaceae bacterium]|nr:MAG: hypothetical protein C3F17_08920 [Bradyrhizobiaceae bacterium]